MDLRASLTPPPRARLLSGRVSGVVSEKRITERHAQYDTWGQQAESSQDSSATASDGKQRFKM